MQRKPKRSKSLTATLTAAFLALSIAVLLISVATATYTNFQTQRRAIADKQQLIAQDAANTVASFIQEKYSVLEAAVRLGAPVHASQQVQEGALGNLLGGAPIVDLILAERMIQTGLIPPTCGIGEGDTLAGSMLVRGQPLEARPRVILINGFSYEGQAGSLLIEAQG